jgi:hypothetical protein
MMRKIIFTLALLLIPAAARTQVLPAHGDCSTGGINVQTQGLNSTTLVRGSYPQCLVTVYLTGTLTLATIYSDKLSTPLTNPFTAQANGSWLFYVLSGGYDITMSGGSPIPFPTPITITDYVVSGAGGGGGPPSPPIFSVQINGNGSSTFGSDPSILENTATHNIYGPQVQYVGSPLGYGDGVTNGITSAFAAGLTNVMANSAYGNTDQPFSTNFGSQKGPAPSEAHFIDQRNGVQYDFYHDAPQTHFNTLWDFHLHVCNQTSWPGWVNGGSQPTNTSAQCESNAGFWSAPGYYYGNPVITGPVNWSLHQGLSVVQNFNSLGIDQGIGVGYEKSSAGDNQGLQMYPYEKGGMIGAADEQMHHIGILGGEYNFTYAGTVATGGGGTGVTTLTTNATADPVGIGQGLYMIRSQAAVETDTATAMTQGSGETPGTFTVNGTAPVSTMIGTLQANVPTPQGNPIGTGTTVETFNVSVSQGTPAANDLDCFGGQFHEQARVTSATFVSGSVWTLVVPLRHAHNIGSVVAANGPCGTFIDFTANHASPQGQLLRWPIDLIAAPNSNTLWFRFFAYSSGAGIGIGPVALGNVYFPTLSASTLTNVGGVVQMTLSQTSQQQPQLFNQPSITITVSTDSTFNGVCTNTFGVAGSPSLLYCTQASSIGHTSASATVALANGQFNTYCGAEVTDPQDESVSPPIINGKFNIEQNGCTWNNGDLVEQPHHYAQRINAFQDNANVWNPYSQEFCLICQDGFGDAMQNGNSQSDNNFVIANFGNGNPVNRYRFHGGTLVPPGGIHLGGNGGGAGGLFNFGLSMLYAPDPIGSAVIEVGPPASGATDCSFNYNPFMLVGANGNSGFRFVPCGNEITTTGAWRLGGNIAAIAMGDRITFIPLSAPVNGAFTKTTTGGQIADTTVVSARIAAQNDNGSTLASTETSTTTGSSGSNANTVTYNWSYVAGATGYLVYCRTAGAEQLCANLNGSTTLSWRDTGSVTPSGALPTLNTTLGGIYNAGLVGINDATSGFTGTLDAPALSGNVTYTLPSASGTLALAGPADITLTVPITTVAANTCTSDSSSIPWTNLTTSMVIVPGWSSTTEVGVAGWDQSVSTGHLVLLPRPLTVGNYVWHLCNPNSGSITSAAYTFNLGAK